MLRFPCSSKLDNLVCAMAYTLCLMATRNQGFTTVTLVSPSTIMSISPGVAYWRQNAHLSSC